MHPPLLTKGYPSTDLAMGFANVRAGTQDLVLMLVLAQALALVPIVPLLPSVTCPSWYGEWGSANT